MFSVIQPPRLMSFFRLIFSLYLFIQLLYSFITSIQGFRKGDTRETHVATTALEELEGAPEQGLLGEDVVVGAELTARDGALTTTVELPEGAAVVVRLDEADVVQVHVVLGVGGDRLALARGFLVRAC